MVKKVKGLAKKPKTHRYNSMVITRGKGGWEELGERKRGINSDERKLDLGW